MPALASRAPNPLFRVYIDESGDRGLYSQKSPSFILAALIVRDADEPTVRAARAMLCQSLGKPPATALHWAQNIKGHPARKKTASVLGQLPIKLSYAIVDKASVKHNPTALGHHARLYNYAARRLLERISWYVRDEGGQAYVTFAHVKNFKYAPFQDYLTHLRGDPTCRIHWQSIIGTPKIDQPSTKELLQWADVAAGALAAAIVPDLYGTVEYAYLDLIQSKIYRRPPTLITSYGLHTICGNPAAPNCVTSQPWWPTFPGK